MGSPSCYVPSYFRPTLDQLKAFTPLTLCGVEEAVVECQTELLYSLHPVLNICSGCWALCWALGPQLSQTRSLREASLAPPPPGGSSASVLSQALLFPPRSPACPEPTLLGWSPHILGSGGPASRGDCPCFSPSGTSCGATQKHKEPLM